MIEELTARAILALWGGGLDTSEIATVLHMVEADVHRFLRTALDVRRSITAPSVSATGAA